MTGWRSAALALGVFAAVRVATEQYALRRAEKRERVCGFEVLEGCACGDCGEVRYVNRTCDELCADPAALQREGLRTVGCTGFRATLDCSPDGVRAPHADDACHVPVHSQISGYCECEGGIIGALWGCGHPNKTCAEMCGRFLTAHKGGSGDALVPQLDVRCAESEPLSAVIGDVAPDWSPGLGPKAERTASARVSAVWGAVHAAFQAATSGEKEVIMGTRSTLADAVESGHEMEAWQVEAAKRMWAAYRRGMPPYPEDGTFDGRGIAIVGGGLHYMVPAWAAVAALRQQGCTLPIELWFMQHELPTPEMRDELIELGVTVRNLDEFAFDGGAVIQGYQTKVFALFFSRFQEVLLLDADNVAVSDPEVLFGSDAYQSTGALLWPDFWDTSIAPDFFRVHDDVDEKWMRDLVGPGTHESGQVVMDKRRHWRAVLALVYFNALPKLYYRLGSNYMGQGDKETFPWAFAAVGETYHRVDASVLSVGRATSGGPGEPVHVWGLAMGQFHPERPFRLMFMHSNIAKWSLEVPNDFRDYRRMWEATSLAAYAFGPHETEALWIESFGEVLRRFGRSRLDDPERGMHAAVRGMKCRPWFARWYALRTKRYGERDRPTPDWWLQAHDDMPLFVKARPYARPTNAAKDHALGPEPGHDFRGAMAPRNPAELPGINARREQADPDLYAKMAKKYDGAWLEWHM